MHAKFRKAQSVDISWLEFSNRRLLIEPTIAQCLKSELPKNGPVEHKDKDNDTYYT